MKKVLLKKESVMFCNKCGNNVPEGNRFCPSCGSPVGAQQAPASGVPPKKEGKGGGFFSTPAGIVVIIVISLLVVGGLTVGVLFLVRGGGNEEFENEISEAWEGFVELTGEMDEELAPVKDLTAITSSDTITDFQKEIKKNREGIRDILKKLKTLTPPGEWKSRYDDLVSALEGYDEYLEKLDKFYTAFLSDPYDTNVDYLLDDMGDGASYIENYVKGFLEDNDVVKTTSFDPDILALSSEYESQLATVRQGVTEQQQETEVENIVTAATVAINQFLVQYVSGGWESASGLMTSECYNQHLDEIPPPDQGDFDVVDATVTDYTVVDANTVVFTVLQTGRGWEDGTEYQDYMTFEMVNSQGAWLVNKVGYIQ